MILISVTRRCLRHDGTMSAKAITVEIGGELDIDGATVGLHPNGCRGQEAAAVWRRTPALVAVEAAIQDLVEEVRTTLGDSIT